MTVYVPQNQTKLDVSSGKYVPRFDLSPAKKYGNLHYLLSPTAKPFLTGFEEVNPKIIRQLHEGLQNFCNDDFLLLIGNPVLIGMVATVAAHYNEGNVKFLQWGKDGYLPVIAEDLFFQE